MSEHKATVLLVDDNAQLRGPLKLYLQRQGYCVIEAGDGLEAIAAAVERLPDAIVLDVMMPVVDGFEVLRRLKQKEATRNIPVLMLTAVNEKKSIVCGLSDGAADYVIKGSVGVKEISHRIEILIEKSRSVPAAPGPQAGAAQRAVSDSALRQILEELSLPDAVPARMAEVTALLNKHDSTSQDWTAFLRKNKPLADAAAALAFVNLSKGDNHDALFLLGAHRLRHVSIAAAALLSLTELQGGPVQNHMLRTAILARSLSIEAFGAGADEAMAAALLHDFGKVLLRNRFPNQYDALRRRACDEGRPVFSLERDLLGTDHAAFAGDLLMAWGIPIDLVDAVRLHHAPWEEILKNSSLNPTLAAVVQIADSLDRAVNFGIEEDDLIQPNAEAAAHALNISRSALTAALERTGECLRKIEPLLPSRIASQAEQPEWAASLESKKTLLVLNREDDMLLPAAFLAACGAIVDFAIYKDAIEKAQECEVMFVCVSEEAEVEEAAGIAEKTAAFEKPLPFCMLVSGPDGAAEKLAAFKILRPPFSLKKIAGVIREAPVPVPVGEQTNVQEQKA